MNRVEKLLSDLCPEGVQLRALSEVCSDFIVPMRDRPKVFDGDIPWCRIEDIQKDYIHGSLSGLKVSQKVISEMNLKVMPTGTVIASCSASLGRYAISTTPLITNQTFIGLVCGEALYNRYLLHLLPLKTRELVSSSNSGKIPYISRIKFERLQIPVPPLEIQHEIVRILDTFTELEAGLEAELEARKTQYAFFRKSLLDRDPQTSRTYKLEDVCTKISSGGTPSRSRADFFGGAIPWVRTQEVDFKEIWSTELNITDLALKNSSANWVPANTVILAMYGATAGKSAITRIPVTTNQACCNLEVDPKLCLPEYLFHWLMANYLEIKSLGQGTQSNLNAGMVRHLQIQLPDLEEQSKAVSALNKFDALTKDMLVGIPAEIFARRQQYEYYRNILLTFKPLEVA